ncbi:MAG TPA: sensor histidine kinase [Actinopolymorphaceae bacterium]|nr:sensor histidine kinase [Actinopolymorphaceae bacterium]
MTRPPTAGYVHEALFYSSDDELLTTAVPFLSEGLAQDETVIVQCRDAVNRLLGAALEEDPRVAYLPRPGSSGRPARLMAKVRDSLREARDHGIRVRGVGEVDFGETPSERIESSRLEAAANTVWAPYPLWGICMYDARVLSPEVMRTGRLTHPYLLTADAHGPNPSYVDPATFLRQLPSCHDLLQETPPALDIRGVTDIADLRTSAHRVCLADSAVPKGDVAEFVYALSEVTTNALVHGSAPVDVRVWTAPDRVLGTVTDHGEGFDDPLAGFVPPDDLTSCQGLWLARNLCDHVDVDRTGGAFEVRLLTGR